MVDLPDKKIQAEQAEKAHVKSAAHPSVSKLTEQLQNLLNPNPPEARLHTLDLYRKAGKLPGNVADAASPAIVKPDGTIEFQRHAASDSHPLLHTWTDKHGNEHHLDIGSDGIHLNNYTITNDSIVRQSGDGGQCVFNKRTGEIDIDNKEGKFTQKGKERTVHLTGDSCTYNCTGQNWSIKDATGRKEATFSNLGVSSVNDDTTLTYVSPGQSAEKLAHDTHPGIFVDHTGHMYSLLRDGTFVSFQPAAKGDNFADLFSFMKGDVELQMSSDGKHKRIRHGNGQWSDVADENIPKDIRQHISGHFIHLDDHRHFDLRLKHIFTEDNSGRHLDWEYRKNNLSVLHIVNGPDVQLVGGHFTLTDSHHPGRKPVIWDPQQQELTTAMGIVSQTVTRFSNGDQVYTDGHMRLRNNDGTYDNIDRQGNLRTADGTTVSSDGHIHTSDGQNYSASGSGRGDAATIGSPANADATAAQADSVAASVQGKSTVSLSDVQALIAEAGNIGALIATCMANGNLESVNRLMASQGTLTEALSRVLAKVQELDQSNQQPTLTQETNQELPGHKSAIG